MKSKWETVLLTGLLTGGVIFKFWFARLNPQPFIYDQWQYFNYAVQMLHNGIWADPSRLYGFPLLLVPLVRFFGDARIPFTVWNAVVDSLTGLLVFAIARRTIGGTVPWIALVLYLVNPFTAGYVGVMLTEMPAILFVTLLGYLVVISSRTRQPAAMLLTGLIAGFLPQIRPGYAYFSAGVLVWLLIHVVRSVKRSGLPVALITLVLFALPFFYNIAANLRIFNQFSVQSVDDAFWREAYLSVVVDKALPTGDNRLWQWPAEAHLTWVEYSSPTTPEGRAAMADKYKDKVLSHFRQDPKGFILSHIIRMKNSWEKTYVYPYDVIRELPYRNLTYNGNALLLILGSGGLIAGLIQSRKRREIRPAVWYSLALFAYMTVTHAFTTGEERFTLPAYPLVILWTAYLIQKLFKSVRLLS